MPFSFTALFRPKQIQNRSLRSESLEISTEKETLLKCAWEDIIEVRKAGNLAYEIRTESGSAKLYWSMLDMSNQGYSNFLRDTFAAMQSGYIGSHLSKYRLPTTLENGKCYEYRIPKPQIDVRLLCLAVACFTGLLAVERLVQGKYLESLGNLSAIALFIPLSFTAKRVRENSTGVTLQIENGLITVTNPTKGAITVPMSARQGRLLPSQFPTPFEGVETYQDETNSIAIDRRFLWPI